MLVKDLVEKLLDLDQDKKIGIMVHSDYRSWILEPTIILEAINKDNLIVLTEATEFAYGITEK
jgi:hypothetical protein